MEGPGASPGGYDPASFARLEDVEDRHFWFRARRRAIGAIAEQVAGIPAPGLRVLDAGCGNGSVLRDLRGRCPAATVIGLDVFAEGLRNASRRAASPLVRADVCRPPFAGSFDLVGLFDVLEHLPDEGRVLAAIRSLLRPGGNLLLTVPAHRSLWSYFDESGRHLRRYSPASLRSVLEAAGFRVEYLSQFLAALYPLVWVGRRLAGRAARRRGPSRPSARDLSARELRVVPIANAVLGWTVAWEVPLIRRRILLPLGTSLIALARPSGEEEGLQGREP